MSLLSVCVSEPRSDGWPCVNLSLSSLSPWLQKVGPGGLGSYKASIMALSDEGKLYRTELEIVLCKDSTL